MVDAFEKNKQTDEDIRKSVKSIRSDPSKRKCGNRLFDDIETCFWIPNSHFYASNSDKKIDTSQILKSLQTEILRILPENNCVSIKPFIVGMAGFNL